jgi:hypothetical protein
MGRAGGSGLNGILHAVASTLDDDGFGVVEKAVEDGRGERAVVVEDGGPVLEGLVGGQVAKFVHDQDRRAEIPFKFDSQAPGVLRGGEGVDNVNGGGKQDAVAGQASGVAQGDAQVAFAQADAADEDDVGLVLDKPEAKKVRNRSRP